MSILLSAIAIFSIFQLGVLAQFYLIKRGKYFEFSLPALFALGLGAITTLFYLAGLLEFYFSQASVAITISIFSLPFFLDARLKNITKKNIKNYINGFKKSPKLFLLLFSIFLAILIMFAFSKTVWGYDAYERWLAKARTFWVDGGITKENAKIYGPSDDHNLWPFTASWIYYINGSSNEIWVRLVPLIAFLLIVFEFKKHTTNKSWNIKSYSWLSILIFTPFLWQTVAQENYSGNADILVSLFFLLSTGAIIKREFLLAVVFLGLASFTKNDAFPALLGYLLLLPIAARNLVGKSELKLVFTVALSFLLANLSLKYYYNLDSRYLNQDFSQIISQKPFLKYNKYSLHAFREQFRQTYIWGLGWWVIFIFLVKRATIIFKNKSLLFAIALIGIQFMGYITIYYISKEDQAHQITTSISRVLLQIYPATLLIIYYANGNYKNETRTS